jgi:hypothetical protein
MNIYVAMFTFLFAVSTVTAQTKLFTKTGTISFKSKTAMENIEAVNNKVLSVWDITNGNIEFSLLVKGFEFDRALMQEHFNENYLESDKYPKAIFKGVVENSKNILLTTNNNYSVKVTGALTMHGVTKQITLPVSIKVKNGEVNATAAFSIVPQDYDIKIPGLVADKINKKIDILITVPAYKMLTAK